VAKAYSIDSASSKFVLAFTRDYFGDYLPLGEFLYNYGDDLGWGEGDSLFG
jgi:hypothetical protein